MKLWRSVVGKLWMTIILLVAVVLVILGMFLLQYVDIAFTQSNSHDIKVLFVITAIIGFLLSTFFAFFLSTKITQPLLQMIKAAEQIARGDYRTRVHSRSTDEIGQLAHTLNHMALELEKLIQDLHHERDHLASVLRSMADAVVTFDADGRVMLANPPGQQVIHEWNGTVWSEEMGENVPPGEVPVPLQELFRKVVREGRDMNDKLHIRNSVWSVVMAPLTSDHTVRGAVAVMRNVTKEHKSEKLRRDFVANVSHELRTPLSMLQGYSEALLDDIVSSPEERKELVQVIHDESLRMGRLVKDLLDLAKMEEGRLELNLRPVETGTIIKRVLRKFQVIAKEQDIRLVSRLPDEPLELKAADEDRLEQVLTNLLDNALRHTPPGAEIAISGSRKTVDGAPCVQIQVKDQGQGIPAEDLPYIFERFYKADKARKRAGSVGTGLGLAIVSSIIEAHKGRIEAESVVGQGTTFTILLPVELHRGLSGNAAE
ncbi:histidine kinase [Paenibacillus sp. 32O-W]|uniref:HAMP domain-containing sensor histidine kinase n=1 Tax=Paenibacillus sp. 32O-W TaxID=1695218 RepID=UPI00072171A6|nr:ATP-binding protein [Paenibacillus sp. 32O-W]ALS27728.1 histidine kinase [Paenibacillus sp. 32O-W]